jgi:hypothetical protein
VTAARLADADAFHDRDELWGIARLARGDQQGQRAAPALTDEMDLARQAAPGASESLVGAVLPGVRVFSRRSRNAPAGRGGVLVGPAGGRAEAHHRPVDPAFSVGVGQDGREDLVPLPVADQRLCRSCTVFHGPKRAGRFRPAIPVRNRYNIPLMSLR